MCGAALNKLAGRFEFPTNLKGEKLDWLCRDAPSLQSSPESGLLRNSAENDADEVAGRRL